MNRPKRKRDWVGLLVKSTRTLTNGIGTLRKGTEFEVIGNFAGLRLRSKECPKCGISLFISKVPECDVIIIGKAA